jgi:mono/diheme cytochrome c family protein
MKVTRRAQAAFAMLLLGAAAILGSLSAVATTQEHPPFAKRDPWMPEWMMEPGGPGPMSPTMMSRMLRHAQFLNFGVPKPYEGAQSTVKSDKATIAEGRALYHANCETCHGPDGMGDGETGKALSPSPAVLAFMITRPIAVDPYLLWSVSEGGKQFESKMPAFKDKLTREEIWKIIAYMRAGFPGPDLEMPQPQP